jgi:hypothetical protein
MRIKGQVCVLWLAQVRRAVREILFCLPPCCCPDKRQRLLHEKSPECLGRTCQIKEVHGAQKSEYLSDLVSTRLGDRLHGEHETKRRDSARATSRACRAVLICWRSLQSGYPSREYPSSAFWGAQGQLRTRPTRLRSPLTTSASRQRWDGASSTPSGLYHAYRRCWK